VPVPELFARIDGEGPGEAYTEAISEPQAPQGLALGPRKECESSECVENTSVADEASDWRGGTFWGASGDGSRVYFSSDQQLTDSASQDGANLYESVCSHPCAKPAEERRLIDVSEAATGGKVAGGPRVQGVMAVSPDGSHIYFVAQGVLTGAEHNQQGQGAADGVDNLYVYTEGQPVRFVASLSAGDAEQWSPSTSVNVTPNGSVLVFTSSAALTADDTRSEGPRQVYRYDALSGSLSRVSIGQDGYNDDGNAGSVAAQDPIVPASRAFVEVPGPPHANPTMSDDGSRVFFQSPVGLTPGALNEVFVGGKENETAQQRMANNVYEWVAPGTGSCTLTQGCVSLISDGADVAEHSPTEHSGGSVELLGTDAAGANVFFATNDALVPQDIDTQRDYYDAHICSEASPCVAPADAPVMPCSEVSCQGPGAAQAPAPTPASADFSGTGNLPPAPAPAPATKAKPLTKAQKLAKALKACRKKTNKKKRERCEKQARASYGPTKKAKRSSAKKANDRRRAQLCGRSSPLSCRSLRSLHSRSQPLSPPNRPAPAGSRCRASLHWAISPLPTTRAAKTRMKMRSRVATRSCRRRRTLVAKPPPVRSW
jgi:hypothetical protein